MARLAPSKMGISSSPRRGHRGSLGNCLAHVEEESTIFFPYANDECNDEVFENASSPTASTTFSSSLPRPSRSLSRGHAAAIVKRFSFSGSNRRPSKKYEKRKSISCIGAVLSADDKMDSAAESMTENDLLMFSVQARFPNDNLQLLEKRSGSRKPSLKILQEAEDGAYENKDSNKAGRKAPSKDTALPIENVCDATSDALQRPRADGILLSPMVQDKFKKMAQRRQSAPSVVIRSVLNRSMRLGSNTHSSRDEHNDNQLVECLPFNFKATGHPINLAERQYVREGRVHLELGLQTQERYLFLFSDLLLIAKSKSTSNYKLKQRVRLSDIWLSADVTNEVTEVTKASERSFMIGWPTINAVATFSSAEVKELWWNDLNRLLKEKQEVEEPKCVNIQVVSQQHADTSSIKILSVHSKQTTKDLIADALRTFAIEESGNNYQLWVASGKDGTAYPLIGHERPHAIKVCSVREALAAKAYTSFDIAVDDLYSVAANKANSKYDCRFVLRRKQSCSLENLKRPSRLKSKAPSSFFGWARKRSLSRSNEYRLDSLESPGSQRTHSVPCESCGMITNLNGTSDALYSPTSSISSTPGSPKLFEQPLSRLCPGGTLPQPVMSMFEILYRKGPSTNGIFRKSANARATRIVKEKINQELDFDLADVHVHVVAALTKDFLRSVPGSILGCHHYSKWAKTCELSEPNQKIEEIKRLLVEADEGTQAVLRHFFCVLHNVARASDHNNMTSFNLAVCIAPSLLWVDATSDLNVQAECSKTVQELAHFMIDNFSAIFGDDALHIFGASGEELDDDSCKTDENAEGTSGDESRLFRGEADDTTEDDSKDDREDEDSKKLVDQFDRSKISRRQIPRRKLSKKYFSSTIKGASSMDSLDQDIMEAQMLVNEAQRELKQSIDKYDCGKRCTNSACPSHRRLSADVCSLSNDSGFTTLSGDDDDGRRNRSTENMIGTSNSSAEDLMSPKNSAGAAEPWHSIMLATLNGRITEKEFGSWSGIRLNMGALNEAGHSTAKDKNICERRRSEPAVSHKSVVAGTKAGSVQAPIFCISPPSPSKERFVSARTSPSLKEEKRTDSSAFTIEEAVQTSGTTKNRKPNSNENSNNNRSAQKPEENSRASSYLENIRQASVDRIMHSADVGKSHKAKELPADSALGSKSGYESSDCEDKQYGDMGKVDIAPSASQLRSLYSSAAREGSRHTTNRSSFTRKSTIERMSHRRCSERAWRRKKTNELFYTEGRSKADGSSSESTEKTTETTCVESKENDIPKRKTTKNSTAKAEKPKSAFVPFEYTASFCAGVAKVSSPVESNKLFSINGQKKREQFSSPKTRSPSDNDYDNSPRRRRRQRPRITALGEALGSESGSVDGKNVFSLSLPSRRTPIDRDDSAAKKDSIATDCYDSNGVNRANLNQLNSFDERLRASSSFPGLSISPNKNHSFENFGFDRSMSNSVRAKINAFNRGTVQNSSTTRSRKRVSPMSSRDSSVKDALLFQHQQSRKTTMPASFVSLDKILKDFNEKEAKPSVHDSQSGGNARTVPDGVRPPEACIESDAKKGVCNNKTSPESRHKAIANCSLSTSSGEKASQLSDEALRTLSATIAFGNRKAPRSISTTSSSTAQNGSHEQNAEPTESTVSPRRRSRRKRASKNTVPNDNNNNSDSIKASAREEIFMAKLKELENAEESYI